MTDKLPHKPGDLWYCPLNDVWWVLCRRCQGLSIIQSRKTREDALVYTADHGFSTVGDSFLCQRCTTSRPGA